MATVTSIVKLSLKDSGVIYGTETPTDSEMQDALSTLNQMMAMWRTQSLAVYCQKQETITVTSAASYSIGPAGDLNIERPVNIDAMYWRLNGVDTPLIPLHSFEDYQDIQVKTLEGTPNAFYYRPASPQGQLFVWPIPNAGSLVLTMRIPMPVYTTIQDDIDLPPEYEGAIRWNLAAQLCSTFGMPITAEIERYAKQYKRALKITNTQLKTMRMPDAVQSTTMYNIRSGY
jgi:hypothetical protein